MNSSKNYMKPQDVVILLKIISLKEKEWFQQTLSEELGISQSEISESLNRSKYSRLIGAEKKNVNRLSLLEFVEFGIKFVFPQQPGKIVRGVPTAHSAPPLSQEIQSEEQYVWPYAKGKIRGQEIIPLYKSVPEAALKDAALYELLALVDAVRVGKVREQKLAMQFLKEKIAYAKESSY